MTPLEAQRLVVGAVVRGTLAPRDLRDLAPGWWRIDGAGLWARGLAELHGWCLAACETSIEARGRVDLPLALRLLARAGWYAGEVRDGRPVGYLPGLARVAPRRGAALRALGVVVWAAGQREEAASAGASRAATEAMREVDRLAGAAAKRRASVCPGLAAAIVAAGGVVPGVVAERWPGMPEGYDPDRFVREFGADAIRDMVGPPRLVPA